MVKKMQKNLVKSPIQLKNCSFKQLGMFPYKFWEENICRKMEILYLLTVLLFLPITLGKAAAPPARRARPGEIRPPLRRAAAAAAAAFYYAKSR
jgi:hypothetical protein